MSARSSSSGRPSSSARDRSASHGVRPDQRVRASSSLQTGEHPRVADGGGGLHRLSRAGPVVPFESDQVDVGAQCAGELGAGAPGVVAGVVVGQQEHHRGQGDAGEDRHEQGQPGVEGVEKDGQQGWDDQPEEGVEDLLSVEPGERFAQDRQLTGRGASPHPGRQRFDAPQPESFGGVRRGGGRGCGRSSGVVRGEPVQGVAQVGFGGDEPPDQQGDAEADEGAGGDAELGRGGGHVWACFAAAPMNRGRGRPVAMDRIQTRVATYSPSRPTSSTCPSGDP